MFPRREPENVVGVAAATSAGSGDGTGPILDAVLSALPIGVIVSDAAGRTVTVNERAAEFQKDYQRAALLTAAVRRAVREVEAQETYQGVVDFAGTGAGSFTLTARGLPNGGIVSVIEDVSQSRQVEAMRRDFVSNVSHELRTPIGAIVVLADSLEHVEQGVVPEIRDHIVNEATRATRLLDELLDLSKLESNATLDFEPIQVSSVIDEVLEAVRPTALTARVTVTVQSDAQNRQVMGSRKDLVSALANLVINAVKYSGESDHVEIEVAATSDECRISVVDHGIGIPPQEHERIFERFYRVDRSRDRATGGSGLGLAIVRHVAANHGGYISVVSREGEGSTFTFNVPLLVEDY